MDQAAIAAAMQRLAAQGKAPSLGNLRRELGNKGSWHDIVKGKRAVVGNGAMREEAHVAMKIEGLPLIGQAIPPRPATPPPPGADELAVQVGAAQAELRAATAAEAALLDERQRLKDALKGCQDARRALDRQRPPVARGERARQEAVLREQETALHEDAVALSERQDVAWRRARMAAHTLDRLTRRLAHAQRRQAQG
jgi:hypothetical protein